MRVAALAALAFSIATGTGAALLPAAQANQAAPELRTTTHRVSLTTSRNVVEGHPYSITIRVGSPRQASRIRVLQQQSDVFGNQTWVLAKTLPVNGMATHRLRLAAVESGIQKTRAKVTFKTRPTTAVDNASTTVWAWVPMTHFSAYYATPGISPYESYAINGTEYPPGWMTYETEPSWETRHTLGHHCKSFSGTLGLVDDSADGSSATITITDGTNTLYTSPNLTPGMDQPVHFGFSRIYRIWIHASNTSPDADTAPATTTHPAIGDPEVLCTGVS